MRKPPRVDPITNEFDIAQIDDVIHGRVRLGVMAYLAASDAAEFNTLKEKVGATDGTLSVHLRKLEEAGYIAIDKSFRNRRPLTTARLTPDGRKAFKRYLEALGRLTGLGN
ncbi:MAG TPA: transcriptional regulator [Hyphomonadaceae bacterium]|nr:transcriptional regulator [Hyphomonadaceae bacterium]